MELALFVVFGTLALIMVGFGLYRQEHSELTIIGFVFLFLLAMLLITSDLKVQTGSERNITYNCSTENITIGYETARNIYTPVVWDGILNKTFGYWLAVCSVVGFIGVIVGLKFKGFK